MAEPGGEFSVNIAGLRVTAIEEITEDIGPTITPGEVGMESGTVPEVVMTVEDDDMEAADELQQQVEEEEEEVDCGSIAVTAGVNSIREMLDDVEEQVERLRKTALDIIGEKESLHTVLDMLVQPEQLEALGISAMEREEIETTAVMLNHRLNGITVNVSNTRSVDQLESLHSVNSAIDQLVMQIQTDSMEASLVCRQFLSAAGTNDVKSPPDCKFERMLLGCSVEDQKNVRRRLLGLLDHIKAITADAITETE